MRLPLPYFTYDKVCTRLFADSGGKRTVALGRAAAGRITGQGALRPIAELDQTETTEKFGAMFRSRRWRLQRVNASSNPPRLSP